MCRAEPQIDEAGGCAVYLALDEWEFSERRVR